MIPRCGPLKASLALAVACGVVALCLRGVVAAPSAPSDGPSDTLSSRLELIPKKNKGVAANSLERVVGGSSAVSRAAALLGDTRRRAEAVLAAADDRVRAVAEQYEASLIQIRESDARSTERLERLEEALSARVGAGEGLLRGSAHWWWWPFLLLCAVSFAAAAVACGKYFSIRTQLA